MQTAPTAQTKPCPMCGEQIAAVARKCRFCNEYLDPSARPKPQHSELERMIIPVNVAPSAMASGYLGLVALLLTVVGLPFGLAALLLGIKALRVIKESSGALTGRGRAIFGIIVGGLSTVGSGIFFGAALISAIVGKR